MADMVAVCVDDPPVTVGDPFAACTSVEWHDASDTWELPDLTYEQWGAITSGLLALFVTVAVIGLVRKFFT